MRMTPDEAVAALQPWIERQKRPCWVPRVTEGDGASTASKFCGTPWLAAHESWPTCKLCEQRLEMLLQLNLDEIPAELAGRFGSGLLQLFYCADDACDHEGMGQGAWEPFSDICTLVRIVQPSGPGCMAELNETFSPKTIVNWRQVVDLPDPSELAELGVIVDYHFKTVPYTPTTVSCEELGLHFKGMEFADKLHSVVHSRPGDKLAGWPHWVQSPEYPKCPRCRSRMQYVMQIDSNDNIPCMFGDCGTGHITQCATHKEVLAFGWACC